MNRAILVVLAFGWPAFVVATEPPSKPIDFDRDVKPILTAHCLKCHGPTKQKGGLRLDSRAAVLTGGNSGAVVVIGQSADSKLTHAIAGSDPDTRMPPVGQTPLTATQIGTLRSWIDQGLTYPEPSLTVPTTRTQSDHWSFQPIRRPAVPRLDGVTHPVDAFIAARLREEKLAPSPEADRVTLIRRLSFDLIGLPPSPREVADFVNDSSPDAYERLADRLLASPHYGERWGRHWLDLARYADSDGYEKDTGRPFAWRYRDYVISAMNRDLPFDQFTIEQLAGDLLPNATDDQKIATGFHRNTLTNKEGGVDQEEFRVAAVVDRVSTTGTAWLGLTVGCCQCHDHKYDPVSQREFYQLVAFFNSDREADLTIPLPGEKSKFEQQLAAFNAKLTELKAAVDGAKGLPAEERKKRQQALTAHQKTAPSSARAMTLSLGPARPTHVLIRGDFLRPGVEVTPGTPAVLPPMSDGPHTTTRRPATRLDLARWIVSPDNPLTARVIANWVWSKYFGRGLVATLADFGTQGEKPSHPELIDWLASELQGPCEWSLKRFHKRIVTSAAYRRSSAYRADVAERDPLNVLLARQSRLRLEAEIVRDTALAVCGLLTRNIGGPSVRPPQPAGVSELTYANSARWVESTGPDRYKRGLYVWFQRTSPYPMLMTFDDPDGNVCAVRRERSNTPLQALTLLNDVVFVEAAQAFARRVLTETRTNSDVDRVRSAVRLALGRTPTVSEASRLTRLLHDVTGQTRKAPAEAAKLVGSSPPAGVPVAEAAAWVAVCRAIMNLDEFVTRE